MRTKCKQVASTRHQDALALIETCKMKLTLRQNTEKYSGRRSSAARSSRASLHPRPFSARSAFRRRDNHISRAITCLCISIIPWRRSPGILARIPRIFYSLCPAARARSRTLRTSQTPADCRCAGCAAVEREGARDGVSCATYYVNQPN